MKRTRLLLGVLVGTGVLALAGLGAWRAGVQGRSFYTDAARIRVPAEGAPLRQILWQPAEPLPDSTNADQYEPRISPDGSTMVLVRGRAAGNSRDAAPGSGADLYSARRTATGWTDPEPLAALNSERDELGPEFAPDGKAIYFYSDRAGGQGGYDLWLASVTPDGWGQPVNLGPAVNSSANEYGAALTPDGTRLYFSSNRPRPGESGAQRDAWPATIGEQRARHDYDIYQCDLESSGSSPSTPVVELNSPADEGAPAMSPAGDFLYFASDRAGGLGGFDIYRSRILRARIQQPENVGPAINSALSDLDPALSMDGFRLYFSTNRPTQVATAPAPTDSEPPAASTPPITAEAPTRYSIWVSSSREVFLESEPMRAGTLARIWAAVWPWLLLLALLTLLCLLMFWFLRDATMRRRLAQLSLMARCLLLSLLIHAAILTLMAAWRVGSAIGDILHSSGGGTRITLGAGAGDGGLAAQVRGSIADVPIHAAPIDSAPAAPAMAELTAPRIALSAPAASIPDLAPPSPAALEAPPSRSAPPPTEVPESLSIVAAPRAPNAEAPQRPTSEPSADVLAGAPTPASSSAPIALAPADTRNVSLQPGAAAIPTVPGAPGTLDAAPASAPATPSPTSAAIPAPNTATLAARIPAGSASSSAPTREPTLADSIGRNLPGALAAAIAAGTPSAARVNSTPAPASVPTVESGFGRVALDVAPGSTNGAAPANPSSGTPSPAPIGDIAARIPDASPDGSGAPAPRSEPTIAGAFDGSRAAGPSAPAPIAGLGSSTTPTIHLDPRATPGTPTLGAPGPAALLTPAAAGTGSSGPSPSAIGIPAIPGSGLAARLPGDDEPTETFAQRDPEVRAEILKRAGGNERTEQAVALALEWFRAHQNPDGRWSGTHFDDRCRHCDGQAEIDCDAAMTGMSLLCFLSAGHTHTADGPYREPVRRALAWIVAREAPDGDLRRGETMYSQTIAAVALCEAYGMTRDPWLEGPARRAVTFVARGPSARDGRDISVLGWQVMALKSAERCGFAVPRDGLDQAARWLDTVRAAPGRYAYRAGDPPTAAATAEAMFVRQLLGHGREEPSMQESASFILATPPAWRRGAPTHYWYYATLALFQQQGREWTAWNEAVARELIDNQRSDGSMAGSWDPQDQWSRLGGRVYQTAVCTLSLQVYYRYRLAEPAP